MDYPQRLKVTRTSPGESDGMGGFTAGAKTVVYEGDVDVQSGGVKVEVEGGTITGEGDATAFLPGSAGDFEAGDSARITWADGTEREATVAQVHRLDDKLILSYD